MKKSTSILRGLTNIRASYILESEIPDAASTAALMRETAYENSARGRWKRITSSGWFAAAVCALVAGGTLAGIIWAGHNAPGTVDPVGSSGDTTEAVQTETEAETEAVIPYTEGLEFSPVEGEEGYCAVSGIGTATDRVLRIPETSPDGLTVKYIGAYAFQKNTDITEVILPDTVEVIQMYAFDQCTALKKVTVGNGFREVVGRAFSDCRRLTEINLKAEHIVGTYAFLQTPWIESQTDEFVIYGGHLIGYNGAGGDVVVPQGVISIEGGAFSYNPGITSVVVPDSCVTLGPSAFQQCTSLIQVVLPPSVTLLNACAFGWCPSLQSIEMPGVTTLAYRTFAGCTSLTRVDMPAATAIFPEAFDGCTALSSVTFGNELIAFLDKSFSNTALTELILPESTQRVGVSSLADCPNLTLVQTSARLLEDNCFKNCPRLREIILLDGVQTLGNDIFGNCPALERLTLPTTVVEIGQITTISSENLVIEYAGTPEDWANIHMDGQTAALLLPYVRFMAAE